MDIKLIIKDQIIPMLIFHIIKNSVYQDMDNLSNKDKEDVEE